MSHGFASRRLSESGLTTYPTRDAWVRPSDWLSVPVPNASEQRFVGLAAVFPNGSNFITVLVGVAFKVDWGDGAGWQYYMANTIAEKNLAWADYSSGTLTSRGYRQALVMVEAQSGNLTTVDLQRRHSLIPRAHATLWLDLAASLPSGSLTLSGSVTHANLEQAVVVAHGGTNISQMFSGCSSLQSLPQLNTSSGTDFSYMFQNCSSLQSIPQFDTSNGTNFSYMFSGCSSLQSLPQFDTSSGTNFTRMLLGCSALQSLPQFDTSNGTNFSYMFQNCSSLQSIPQLNTSSGTNFSYMFNACSSLQSIPQLDTANGLNFSNMVNGCSALQVSDITGSRYAISYTNCMLSSTELDNIYTNLGTAAGAQTITVSGNWGTASDDPSIATAKGWTVSGS